MLLMVWDGIIRRHLRNDVEECVNEVGVCIATPWRWSALLLNGLGIMCYAQPCCQNTVNSSIRPPQNVTRGVRCEATILPDENQRQRTKKTLGEMMFVEGSFFILPNIKQT